MGDEISNIDLMQLLESTEADLLQTKAELNKYKWRGCDKTGAPLEYDGQDWVIVQFVERGTGFKLIPRMAEWMRHSKKWSLLGEFEDGYMHYIQHNCVAIGWTEIPAFTKTEQI